MGRKAYSMMKATNEMNRMIIRKIRRVREDTCGEVERLERKAGFDVWVETAARQILRMFLFDGILLIGRNAHSFIFK